MITQLTIKNYALIDSLDMEFHKGFSVITGETGAGKSIILGAIALLLGQRADSKTVKSGESRCIIEAHFDLSRYNMEDFFTENDIDYDTSDTILRRELTSAGKSRAFINDTPVGLSVMRQLGQQLVDIHSQHQNLLLQEEDFQLNVVDVIANNHELLQQYKAKYNELHAAERELESLKQALQKASNDEDFLRFQLQELQDANLEEGMQEELEQEAEMLSHAEEIKSALYEADTLLTGSEQCIVDQLKNALRPLSRITDVYPKIAEAVERLESAHVEIKDIAQEIGSATSQVDYDPQRLEIVNSALDTIYSLQKKHHVESVDELIALRDNMEKQLQQIENSDEALAEQEQTVKRLLDEALQLANKLSATRKKAAANIEKEMRERLVPLGMPNVQFKVSLMLALKAMISGTVKLPTIIFDEIDTGVSGKIAEKMGHIMREMGQQERQVISITHLPQIASLGSTHYKVYKEDTPEGTKTFMRLLSKDERINEIAQMLSGSDITEAAINNAKELMNKANP